MPGECIYKGVKYENGATVCQEGREFICKDGAWEAVGSECSEAGPPPAVAEDKSGEK